MAVITAGEGIFAGEDLLTGEDIFVEHPPVPNLPAATVPAVTFRGTTILYGDLRTGRIAGALAALSCSWQTVANGSGSIDQVVLPEDVVRDQQLYYSAPTAKTFLAVEQAGRIREAGPLWARRWDEEKGRATFAAAGLWSLFDHRKVVPVLLPGERVQEAVTTAAGTDLGGIARALVAQAMAHVGGDLPVVLPDPVAGTRAETFYGWQLQWVGQQLRELTQRELSAPDIRFQPRRQTDPRFIEWEMQAGTEDEPLLSQVGADWIFDRTAPRSQVLGISTDEDATGMGTDAWVTGNGMEQDILISHDSDSALINAGYPKLEVEEGRHTVEFQGTLDGHAANLLDRSARPIEVWKLRARTRATVEIAPGHYTRVITKDDAWLGATNRRLRVYKLSGDLGDEVTIDMYPVEAFS